MVVDFEIGSSWSKVPSSQNIIPLQFYLETKVAKSSSFKIYVISNSFGLEQKTIPYLDA